MMIFTQSEGWSYLDSSYFCITSLLKVYFEIVNSKVSNCIFTDMLNLRLVLVTLCLDPLKLVKSTCSCMWTIATSCWGWQ